MAVPTSAKVATKTGDLDGETPLEVGCGSPDYGRFRQQSAPNLADDPIQSDAGKRVEVFEDEPGSGMEAHFFHHARCQVLAAMCALARGALDKLSTGHARRRVTMPHFLREGAERAEAGPSSDFQGMVPLGKALLDGAVVRRLIGRETFGLVQTNKLLNPLIYRLRQLSGASESFRYCARVERVRLKGHYESDPATAIQTDPPQRFRHPGPITKTVWRKAEARKASGGLQARATVPFLPPNWSEFSPFEFIGS